MTDSTKIFGIGYPKTGSKSLAAALRMMGYEVLHDEISIVRDRIVKNDLTELKNTQFDAFINVSPKAFFLYDREFPNSKFILTTRSPDSWIKSISRWRRKLDLLVKNNCLSSADIFSTDSYSLHVLLEYIENYSSIATDDQAFIYKFKQHTEEVQSYFKDRPLDLLTLDLGSPDNHIKLSRFLSTPWPAHRLYPHENKSL
mgnify:FL=1|tara:strand:+ start:417 stop:1016 length:600 start_codon:yes stop_codon:yes gene_type:complete